MSRDNKNVKFVFMFAYVYTYYIPTSTF